MGGGNTGPVDGDWIALSIRRSRAVGGHCPSPPPSIGYGDGLFISRDEWNKRDLTFVESAGNEVQIEPQALPEEHKIGEMSQSIQTSDEPLVTACDALHVTAVTKAVYESARTDKRVSINL